MIVEGVDGAGKTTLVEELAEEYGCAQRHVGPPNGEMTVLCEHLRYVDEAEQHDRVVFDRFHLGTYAYQEFRPEKNVDGIGDFHRQDWRYLEKKMHDRCVLVLCRPPLLVLEAEWERRKPTLDMRPHPEYERDTVKLHNVVTLFDEAYHYSTLTKILYDYTKEFDWQQLTELLWECLGWSARVSA